MGWHWSLILERCEVPEPEWESHIKAPEVEHVPKSLRDRSDPRIWYWTYKKSNRTCEEKWSERCAMLQLWFWISCRPYSIPPRGPEAKSNVAQKQCIWRMKSGMNVITDSLEKRWDYICQEQVTLKYYEHLLSLLSSWKKWIIHSCTVVFLLSAQICY